MHQGLRMCHWDIKPHNIMFDFNEEIKLADFGTSKLLWKDDYWVEHHGEGEQYTSTANTGF